MEPERQAKRPVVWILVGAKGGDNAQIRALAAATGFERREIPLEFNAEYRRSNLLLGATLRSLTETARQRLSPPWPDLVISSGRRSVPVARWIAAQSGAKLVHVGRPWGRLRWFDLVIAMPQYAIPARANVFQARMPFNQASTAALQAAAARWGEEFSRLPRPVLAVLLGGSSPPLALDAATATQIAHWATRWALERGGSVVALTSPRTQAPAAEAFFAALQAPGLRHAWQPGAGDNPYPAALALADEFVVTGDSASMLAEAIRRGKPVRIAPVPMRLRGKHRRAALLQRLLPAAIFQMLAEWTVVTPNRDLRRLHRRLVESGLASWLEDPPRKPVAFEEDMPFIVARIGELLHYNASQPRP